MIRRLRRGTGTTDTHTGHDDQSETDSQSQFSEEANLAPSKRKALVCTDKDCQRSSGNTFAASCRINVTFIQRPVVCFYSA